MPSPTAMLTASGNTNMIVNYGNGIERFLESTRDGALFTADWRLKAVLAGQVFVANAGSVTTPLTFLVTAANRPDVVLRVPTGTVIVPLSVEVVLETAAGTATELDIRMAQNDIGNGTSSAISVGPINMRSDAPRTSNVTARQLYTADATAETNPVSLHRITFPQAATNGMRDYSEFWTPQIPPILIGPASLEVFLAATSTQATGFAQLIWFETQPSWVQN